MKTGMEQLEGRTLFAGYAASTVPELIAAINSANATVEADTITLVAGKVFTLTAVDHDLQIDLRYRGGTGLPSVVAGGGGLTIIGNGDTIERTSSSAFRLFDIPAGGSLSLQNLTLQGGLAENRYGFPAEGGAIHNQGTLSLEGVTLQNNTAQGRDGGPSDGYYFFIPGQDAMGGGVYSSGSLTLSGCTIQNNSAIGGAGNRKLGPDPGGDAFGGGIFVASGTATIRDCSITRNVAKGGSAGGVKSGVSYGGGIYISPAASVGLNAFTVNHVSRNAASSFKDIFGGYLLIA